MNIPLFGASGQDIESDNSDQLSQNLYPHYTETGKSKVTMYPTPGLKAPFAQIGLGPIRGSIEYNDVDFKVSGSELYEIASDGTSTLRGTLSTSLGRVTMAHNGANNGTEILICTGTNGYIWDSAAVTLTLIADGDFPQTATHCAFFDGFFIANDPTVTGQFAKSASYDGTAWDVLEIATAERSPDALQALIVSNRQLWLVGTHTAEKWFNSGAADFPFEPDQSGFSQWGTIAPYSLLEIAGFTFWLSQNDEGAGMVVMTAGGNPQVISSPEISAEIQKLSKLTDAYALAYQKYGHTFYVLTFPTAGKTFAYDILTQKWITLSTESTSYWRASTHTYVFNKHLVGDPINGNVYEMDWETYTDNGEQITRIRRSQNIQAGDKSVRHLGVWIDVKEAVADATTTDPQILLRWKDDNGSWSNYHSRSMGKVGEHNKKCIWRNLGRSRDRVYEIRMTDPVNYVLIDGFARLEADEREFG